jgi:hypothetical protein
MATFAVQQGKRYRAEILLSFFERIVSNETIQIQTARSRFL